LGEVTRAWDNVTYPYPTFYGNVIRGIAQDAEKVPGFKLAAKAMQKFVRGKDSQNVTFAHGGRALGERQSLSTSIWALEWVLGDGGPI